MPQIRSVDREHVESEEEWRFATEQEISEVAPSIRIQAADLAIQDRGPPSDLVSDLASELRPGFEFVAVSRDEGAATPAMCASARKPSILGSKIQSGPSKGSGMRTRRIGVIARESVSLIPSAKDTRGMGS